MATTSSPSTPSITPWPRRLIIIFSLLGPITVAMLFYRDDHFDPAPLPDAGPWPSPSVPVHHRQILPAVEKLAYGLLNGPEDFAYDADDRLLYTGCADGWIKRLNLSDLNSSETVDDWVYVGGRPLGIAFGPDKELIVAESDKGLMRVSKEGAVELLADKAEGVKFRLTDGVDVASDGVIYFTDASSKYSLPEHMLDIMEGRGYGRLMSYDPSTKSIQVLVKGLYFANGVALSPLQDYLLFCQTVLRKCQKYHLQGEKKGVVEDFIDNLPGFPDNIRYDGEGHFWIGIATARTRVWDILLKYPILRKSLVTLDRYVKVPHMQRDAGVLGVSLEGEAVALYSDPSLHGVTAGLKIGDHLYYGLLTGVYIGRINLTQYSPHAAAVF